MRHSRVLGAPRATASDSTPPILEVATEPEARAVLAVEAILDFGILKNSLLFGRALVSGRRWILHLWLMNWCRLHDVAGMVGAARDMFANRVESIERSGGRKNTTADLKSIVAKLFGPPKFHFW